MLTNTEYEEYSEAFTSSFNVDPRVGVPPPIAAYGPILVSYPSIRQRKRYERLRSDNSRPHTVWKPCEHYLRTWDPNDVFPEKFTWTTRSWTDIGHYQGHAPSRLLPHLYSQYGDVTIGDFPLEVDRLDGGFVPEPPGLSALVDQSLQTLLPHIKSELSLVNSIIELKDFSSLPRTLGNIGSLGKKFLRKFRKFRLSPEHNAVRKTFKKSHGPTLREYYRATADGYLQAEFNILPLLSDITGIGKALDRSLRISNRLVNDEGKRRVKHYVQHVNSTVLANSPSTSLNGAIVDTSHTYYGPDSGPLVYSGMDVSITKDSYSILERSLFHAQIEFNYSFSAYQREHARMLTLLDLMGVNFSPSIFWNAIPWSFVVDWVVNVSSWLDTHGKVLNMEPQTNITQYMWSWQIWRRRRSLIRQFSTSPNGCDAMVHTYLPNVYERAYRRDVGIPAHNSIITSGVSIKELTLGVALASTRTKRHKRAYQAHAT